MNVALSLAEDPLLGVVVDQFEATGGSLDLGAPSFTASFPPHVAISTAATNWFLNPDSAPVAPVATAPNRSEIPLAAFGLRLMAGIFTATGTALGQAVATAYDFSLVEPATLFAGEPVVLETSPAPGGGTNLTLSMSFDSVTLAIPSPMMAPLILRGDLVLTGAVPTALPAFSGTALRAVQVLLLVAGALLVSWPRQRPGQPGALANAPARYRWGRALSLRRLRGR